MHWHPDYPAGRVQNNNIPLSQLPSFKVMDGRSTDASRCHLRLPDFAFSSTLPEPGANESGVNCVRAEHNRVTQLGEVA
jgi:hypothetical protein